MALPSTPPAPDRRKKVYKKGGPERFNVGEQLRTAPRRSGDTFQPITDKPGQYTVQALDASGDVVEVTVIYPPVIARPDERHDIRIVQLPGASGSQVFGILDSEWQGAQRRDSVYKHMLRAAYSGRGPKDLRFQPGQHVEPSRMREQYHDAAVQKRVYEAQPQDGRDRAFVVHSFLDYKPPHIDPAHPDRGRRTELAVTDGHREALAHEAMPSWQFDLITDIGVLYGNLAKWQPVMALLPRVASTIEQGSLSRAAKDQFDSLFRQLTHNLDEVYRALAQFKAAKELVADGSVDPIDKEEQLRELVTN